MAICKHTWEIGAVSVRSLTLFIESKTGVNISTHSIRRFDQKKPTDSKLGMNSTLPNKPPASSLT